MSDKVVYIRFERNIEIKDLDINIGRVANVFSPDKALENRVKSIELIKVEKGIKKARYVFLMIDVIRLITKEIPYVTVENVGEEEFVLDYIDESKPEWVKKFLKYANLVLVCGLTFAGSAFSIIAYDNDVDIGGIFKSIGRFFGVYDNYKVLEFMYVLGFALGMIVFYNHFAGKRISSDPTPIEVEECAYEREVSEAIFDKDKVRREKHDGNYGGPY